MAGLVAVDTDLLIDYLRGRGPGASLVRDLLATSRLRFTAVTVFETCIGTDFLDRRDAILRLFRSRTVPMDLAAALIGGRVHAELQNAGRGIGLADAMQAGACIRYGLPLATRNQKHFERVPDLELVSLA